MGNILVLKKANRAESRYNVGDQLSPLQNRKGTDAESTAQRAEKEPSSHEENHQKIEEDVNKALEIGPYSVWALGLTIVIGGQYFAWNEGFSAGFGSEIISVIFIGLGYIALCLCNAELTSSLPFAGGAYGLARLTLGLFPGFLIGCCETVEYIIYVASSTISLSRMISDLAGTTDEIIPIYCLIFYFIASGILIAGGQFFWRISSFFGALSLIILLMYCLGSLPYTDFRVYAVAPSTTGIDYLAADYDTGADSNPMYFIGGMQGFMKILPLASWFYVGVESLNFSAGVVSNPKTNIPIGSICCVLTLFFCAIFVVFVTAALPSNSRTGVPTAFEPTPFSTGFALMFRIPDEIAIIFSLPATFATAYGFVFAYSRIMIAMARSALLPPLLMRTYGKYHTPYVSIIVGSLISYGLCLLVYFRPTTGQYLFPTCILSAFCAYVCQFVGYIIFKVKYDQHKRLFTSPWGISGAVFGAIVFFIGAVAVCIFQEDEYYNLMIMSVLICTYTLAYFGYSKKKQNFSAEEKIFWPVHILKFNQRNRLVAQRNGKKQRNINSKRVSSGGNQLDVSNIASNKNNLSHTNSVAKNTLGVATTLKTNVVVGRHSFTLGDTLHFVRKATDAIYAKSLSLPVVLKSPGNPQLSKGKKNAICPGEESMIEIYEESDYPENVHVEHSESEYPSSVKILTRVEEGRSFNKEIYPLGAMSSQSHSSDSGENAERKLKMTRNYSSARDLC